MKTLIDVLAALSDYVKVASEWAESVIAKAEMNVKNIPLRQVITSFAGLLYCLL